MEQMRMDAERIRQIRQRMQLTQEDFAHLIGVTFSTVNRWENGKSSGDLFHRQPLGER